MNPNGGEGSLGTRGIVLQEHYAIHGTNKPSSIGHYNTLGCIRLLNENIENLYSYIPIGTPFKVKIGNVPSPVFSHSLPAINVLNPSKDKPSIEKGTSNKKAAVNKGAENINKMNNSSKNTKCECNPNKIFNWNG